MNGQTAGGCFKETGHNSEALAPDRLLLLFALGERDGSGAASMG